MKILTVSTDRKIFEESSEVRRRMLEYGTLVDELHIVIFSRRNALSGNRLSKLKISENTFAYPTNSRSRWFYVFDAAKIGVKIIKNIGGDFLVSAQDPFETGLAGHLIAKRAKTRLQLQIHTDFLSPYFKKTFLLNRLRVAIAKFLIPRASCVRVVSRRIKDSLSVIGPQLSVIAVLPIFVDIEKIRNAPVKTDLRRQYPRFDFIILMASRLTKEKNIGMAIKAIKGIVKRHPNTGLIIVGEGPEKNNLKSQILNLKIGENVIIENWADDMISYYKTSDLFLLASDYEGYGRTVIEAMAASCPVVMTDVGIAGEMIKDGYSGLVVPVGDARALEEAILKVREDEFLRGNLVVSAEYTLKDLPDKGEYLERYKKTWENCGLRSR